MSALDLIKFNTDQLITDDDLAKRFKEKRVLRVKLGVDPTRPDLTFGHWVVFNKLRQFQDLGHKAILIIGDYTALIGDPSGQSVLRPVLTKDEIKKNSETYLQQAFKVLDKKHTTVRYNSEWFGDMSFEDALRLTRKMTVARMLERDDFAKRYKENTPISIIEFLYPLVQGYDSLVLDADVEIGGTDQLFNMLVGRTIQKDAKKQEQIVLTMPLLVGLDGKKKMSKSADNYIAFNDTPKEIFGKVMSVDDNVMWDYYRLLLNADDVEIEDRKQGHPMDAKKELARHLTAKIHNKEIAENELNQFQNVFSGGKKPDEMPSFSWASLAKGETSRLIDLLGTTKLFPSKKEARRLVEQGAIKIDGNRCQDPNASVHRPETEIVIQSGKRTFLKIIH
mgnify:CR=1 FL=1